MSRETDSSPSGSQGRGKAAYPSGTPPYGSPTPSAHPQQDASGDRGAQAASRPDEPRTETTLTTRVRINIPGSRPIPPVVMRTPMAEGEATDGRGIAAGAASAPEGGAPESPAERTAAMPRAELRPRAADTADGGAEEPAKPAKKAATSDWFAPRKPMSPGATQGGAAGAGEGAAPFTPSGPTTGPATGDGTLGGAGARFGQEAERPGTTPPGTSPYGEGPFGVGDTAGPGTPAHGFPGLESFDTRPGPGPAAPAPYGAEGSDLHGTPAHAPAPGTPGVPGTPAQGVPGTPAHGTPGVPGPGAGQDGPPRLSDDTAILTPQQPAPPGQAGPHVSGDTLTSGAHVTPESGAPFPGSAPKAGVPRPDLTPRLDDRHGPSGPPTTQLRPTPPPPPTADDQARATKPAAPAKPRKKGRSKPALLLVALVVIAAGVYGAGLVMSHSEVPQGTTVLGLDIGGGTRDQAVDAMEQTFGKRANQPLKLSVGGRTVQLVPQNAGLTLDSQDTVLAASGRDYNPVDVVGALFGRQRVVQPAMPVDEEKLSAALGDLAGQLGSEREGTISFTDGTPTAVPGKAGTGLDVDRAKIAVEDAYRTQVQTGRQTPVTLPVVAKKPTIDQAAIDEAMHDFAQPAMSGLVTIKAPSGQEIQFGGHSLPKILGMRAENGKLVDTYDLNALKEQYGSVFDGVMITRSDGSKTAVTPQDVADQLRVALRGKTPAERVRTLGEKTG